MPYFPVINTDFVVSLLLLDVYTHSFHFQLGSRVDLGCLWWGLGSCASLCCRCFKPNHLLGIMSQSALITSSSWASTARRKASMALEAKAGLVSGLWTGPGATATPPAGSAFSIAGPLHWALTLGILVGTSETHLPSKSEHAATQS